MFIKIIGIYLPNTEVPRGNKSRISKTTTKLMPYMAACWSPENYHHYKTNFSRNFIKNDRSTVEYSRVIYSRL